MSDYTPASVADKFTQEPLEYGGDYSSRLRKLAPELAKAGLVLAAGESDDLMALYGALKDEVSAYDGQDGTPVLIDSNGVVPNYESIQCRYDEFEMENYFKRKANARLLTIFWHGEGNPCWTIKTDIPHQTFDVMEDGEVFSRGIIFSLSDAFPA